MILVSEWWLPPPPVALASAVVSFAWEYCVIVGRSTIDYSRQYLTITDILAIL